MLPQQQPPLGQCLSPAHRTVERQEPGLEASCSLAPTAEVQALAAAVEHSKVQAWHIQQVVAMEALAAAWRLGRMALSIVGISWVHSHVRVSSETLLRHVGQ
mmetsp:Transcript_47807/g.86458  ORF Transcript_47807/g.86458 Transcript_47807/m.86458 type:complete len:102 (+) Transcript_47807:994-1299(+)